jgi:hypothetical protein
MFREVSVVEIREVLRAWLAGHGSRRVAHPGQTLHNHAHTAETVESPVR